MYKPTRQIVLSTNPSLVSSTMPDGGQSGFVVPLHIKYCDDNWQGGASDVFSVAQSGGQDITFWNEDGLLQYAHSKPEIYIDTAGSQELLTRILIPSLSSSVSTNVVMKYGDAICLPQWSDGYDIYKTVDNWGAFWTLEESSGDLFDQTANNHDGTRDGAVQASGQLGHGQLLGVGNAIPCATMPPCGASADWTISFWAQMSNPYGALYQYVIEQNRDGINNQMYIWFYNHNNVVGRLRVRIIDNDGSDLYAEFPVTMDGGWHLYNVAYLALQKTVIVYEDSGHLFDITEPFLGESSGAGFGTIGNRPDRKYPVIGTLDEVSISNSLRSSDWIATDYNVTSDNNTFWTVGDAIGIGASCGYYFRHIINGRYS